MKKKKNGKPEKEKSQAAGKQDTDSGSEEPSKPKRKTIENLLYWLQALYRESPGFVWLYLAGIGVSIGISLLGVYLPSVLVEDITQDGTLEGMLADLMILGGGLVCLYLLNNWLERTKVILGNRLGQRQVLQAAKVSLETDYDNIERAEFPEELWQLIDRYLWSMEYTTGFLGAFAVSATAIIGMILYTGMLSGLSLWILLIVIAGTAVNHFVGIRCNKWDAKNRHKWIVLDYKMVYLSRSTSTYESSKDVHLYWMPPWLKSKFNRELKERLGYTVRQQGNYFLIGAVNGFTQMIWEGAAYLYLIYLVCQGSLTAAEFVLYFGVVTGFATWCASIVGGMRQLHEKASYVEEQRSFLDKLRRGEETGKEELTLKEGHVPEISFSHVTFRYRGAEEPVIRDLNLTLKPGENVALVGLNGAGKTTFIKLLCGFYDPTEGEILIDGVNRNRYSKASWLKYFSGVFQDAELLPLSLAENLALGADEGEISTMEAIQGENGGGTSHGRESLHGREAIYGGETSHGEEMPCGKYDADKRDKENTGHTGNSRMEECLKMADLEEKVRKLPKGLETMFGKESYEDAVDFSGGELQKLLLARALYKQAPLLVLDEPTAALDPLMESELYQQYRRFSEDKTTVFISHRLASTRFCDRILLMEDGSLVECGTHEALLAQDGKYAWMFRLQSKYYQKKDAQREAGLEGDNLGMEAPGEKGASY